MSRDPTAPSIGGFGQPDYLAVLHGHHPLGTWSVIDSDEAFVPLAVHDDMVSFVGHEDLVDYRAPLGAGAGGALIAFLEEHHSLSLSVDSLPAEAADLIEDAARQAGRNPSRTEHETTARLDVADGFDAYMARLSKKERHELRRKRRRYEEELGPARIARESQPGPMLDDFFRLHRAASGDKGQFMTEAMADYFCAVLEIDGWFVDCLVDDNNRVTAAAFGFEDRAGFYLYNSAYDPGLRHVSPGIVMIGLLIEQTANGDEPVFDFLKGDEVYKYRLGAQSRQLYSVTA